MYGTPVAMSEWHAKHEEYLVRRQPIATVGILYSQRNHDFFGRDEAELMVNLPQRGFLQPSARARIPYILVNADDLERDAAGVRALILPNLGTMTDAQVARVRAFVKRGGGIVATGATGLFDEWGDARPDLALADELGVSFPASHPLRTSATRRQLATENTQSYLRLTPELRAKVYGPHVAGEPTATGTRHPVLKGFDETRHPSIWRIAPRQSRLSASARVLLTFVPPRPAF